MTNQIWSQTNGTTVKHFQELATSIQAAKNDPQKVQQLGQQLSEDAQSLASDYTRPVMA